MNMYLKVREPLKVHKVKMKTGPVMGCKIVKHFTLFKDRQAEFIKVTVMQLNNCVKLLTFKHTLGF